MASDIQKTFETVVLAVIGLAILSVIVSKRSATSQVIQSFASAIANVVSAAVKPVSGAAVFNAGGGSFGGHGATGTWNDLNSSGSNDATGNW
jgi:hypothetical protein